MGGRKPTYLTSSTSVLTSVKAISVVPSGGNKMDVHRENTDVRWVGFHPLPKNTIASYSTELITAIKSFILQALGLGRKRRQKVCFHFEQKKVKIICG
jgi:hypothetical protein